MIRSSNLFFFFSGLLLLFVFVVAAIAVADRINSLSQGPATTAHRMSMAMATINKISGFTRGGLGSPFIVIH